MMGREVFHGVHVLRLDCLPASPTSASPNILVAPDEDDGSVRLAIHTAPTAPTVNPRALPGRDTEERAVQLPTTTARRGRSSTCVTCLRGHAGRSGSRSRARGGRSARSSSSCWLAAGCCVVQCCTPHAAGAGSAKYSSSSVMTSDGVLEGTNSGHPRSVSAPGAHVGGWTVLQETRKVGWQKC